MDLNIGTPPEIRHPAEGAFERIGGEMDAILNGEVAFDGTTGAPIRTIVDGEEAEVRLGQQRPLVEVSVEELIHDLARASALVKARKKAKKNAVESLKEAQDTLNAIADALCERDAPSQDSLPFDEEE